jgi:hypothetical protein
MLKTPPRAMPFLWLDLQPLVQALAALAGSGSTRARFRVRGFPGLVPGMNSERIATASKPIAVTARKPAIWP